MAPTVHTSAPLLPVNISESPLLSGSTLLPCEELLTALAGPLPTITIGLWPPPPASNSSPSSPRLGSGVDGANSRRLGAALTRSPRSPHSPRARKAKLLPKLALPPLASLAHSSSTPSTPTTPLTPTTPSSTASSSRILTPKQVVSLLDLLESMEHDVAMEVQRVRLGIQETRMLVQACREDGAARESARQRRLRTERC